MSLAPVVFLASAAACVAGVPVFDVPRVPNCIAVDGEAGDWRGEGLKIGWLPDPRQDGAPAGFEASAWLGWNQRGLLVAVETVGGFGVEADAEGALYQGSGIEIFAGTNRFKGVASTDSTERNVLQPVIAPGRDPRHPKARCYIYDYRLPALRSSVAPHCEFAARHEGAHVVYEVLIPWCQFGLEPEEGMMFGLQIHANDADASGRRTQLRWNAAPGKGQTLRLAGGPGRCEAPGSATATYEDWRRIRVVVKSAPHRTVRAAAGEATAEAVTGASGRALLHFPMPPWGESGSPISVSDDAGKAFAWIELPDATKARHEFLEAMPLTISGDNVFSGDVFPALDPIPGEAALSLVEPGSVRVRYFNRDCEERKTPDTFGRYFALVSMRSKGGKEIVRRVDLFRAKRDIDPHLQGTDEEVAEAAGAPAPRSEWERQLFGSLRHSVFDDFARSIANRAATLSALQERDGRPARVMCARLNAWYRLDKRLRAVGPVRHIALLPSGHDAQPGKKWPVVVFLHGTGGNSEKAALAEPIREFWQGRADRDFILLQPLAPRGTSWVPDQLIDWLDETLPLVGGDPSRVVLTGFSMGGIGTWNLACSYPRRFAAFVPLASVGEPSPVDAAAGRPVWCFHGDRDAMPWKPAAEWAENLRRLNPEADVRFTLLENTDHTNTSERVYRRKDLEEWMIARLRGIAAAPNSGSRAPGDIAEPQPDHKSRD